MKKSLVGMLALLAGAYAVHAQGTVLIGNYGPVTPYIYVSYKPATGPTVNLGGANTGGQLGLTAAAYGNAATLANGNDWTVQLYGALGSGLASSSLSPLAGATTTMANGVTDPVAGTWFSTTVAQIGPSGTLAGAAATVQLYAWYNDGGTITSYDMAVADGVPAGFSATESLTTGGPNVTGPPSTASALTNPGGVLNFSVSAIPEPSTIALGVIGASAFLMRLRRKN